jgi:hypothetical protein
VTLLPNDLSWWFYPFTLLGPWIAMTLVASAGLTGRLPRFIAIGGVLFAGWIAMQLLGKYFLSEEWQERAQLVALVILGGLCLAGTLAAFMAAWRRGLIGWPAIYVAGSAWLVLTAVCVLTLTKQSTSLQWLAAASLASAGFALAVAPLATAPLALAWNRNR